MEYQITTTMPMGMSPHSHIGHVHDIGKMMDSLPADAKYFTLSDKIGPIDKTTKRTILDIQCHHLIPNNKFASSFFTGGAGGMVREAVKIKNRFKNTMPTVLNIVVGPDREEWANRFVRSVFDNKIDGVTSKDFKDIVVHCNLTRWNKNVSGTAMRTAIVENRFEDYCRMLGGDIFARETARRWFILCQEAITRGDLKVKRY